MANDIENPPPNLLATSLKNELDALSPLSSMGCIYRVSEPLRHGNNRAYTPQVVSIGPIHHGKEELKPMEEHKKRNLLDFLKLTNKSLEYYIEMIRDKEQLLRSCYVGRIGFTSDEFVKIVLVDAAFIIEVLWCRRKLRKEYGKNLFNNICNDLLLLENQLPFFILNILWKIVTSVNDKSLSILDLVYRLFKSTRQIEGKDKLQSLNDSNVVHFVDFLRSLYVPSSGSGGKISSLTIPRMTELHKAGVKFKVTKRESLFDLKFSNGVLEIPKFKIFDSTELTIRNLVAFEQYHHNRENYMTDYVVMMTNLVDTPEDVGLLVKYGIIENGLGNNAEVSTLINKLGDGVVFNSNSFYFAKIFEELNKYSRTSWNHWKANLKHNYFNTPWATVSVIAAILLIILTIIQSVCSIISVIR